MREGLLHRVQTSGFVYKYCAFILKGIFGGLLMLFFSGCIRLFKWMYSLKQSNASTKYAYKIRDVYGCIYLKRLRTSIYKQEKANLMVICHTFFSSACPPLAQRWTACSTMPI